MKPAPGGDTPSTKKVVSPQGASDEGGRCLQAEQRTNPLRQAADHHIVVVMRRDAALDLQPPHITTAVAPQTPNYHAC